MWNFICYIHVVVWIFTFTMHSLSQRAIKLLHNFDKMLWLAILEKILQCSISDGRLPFYYVLGALVFGAQCSVQLLPSYLVLQLPTITKQSARGLWLRTPGFLKLLWFACRYVHRCVHLSICVSTPKGINNQWHDMVWYKPCAINQVSQLFPALIILYDTCHR